MKKMMIIAALTLIALAAHGQKKESLALLPFTGGQSEEGEYIVAEFARQRILRDAFNRVTLVTRTTQGFMRFEQKFQRDSGLTDADTIFELGKQLNAEYVIAGYITKLGTQNLVLASILNVESLQLVAGDYRAYKNIEEVDALIPEMARKLAESVRRDTSKLPGLSVPPFEAANGVNAGDAQVLAQILAISVANGSKYAVLPRTDDLQRVMAEHQRQRTGETDQERVRRLGQGRNALYVLAGSVTKLSAALTKFAADVLNIENGDFIDGYSERYTALTDGMDVMPKLAASLNGTTIVTSGGGGSGGGTATGTSGGGSSGNTQTQTSVPANMVRIAGGTFTMGSPASEVSRGSSETQHSVTISKPFYIGKYEVTQKEWVEVMGSNPSNWKGDNLPVENVSWYDVIEYCNKRSDKEGLTPAYTIDKTRSDGNNSSNYDNVKWVVIWNRNANGYRLPTEAEWELACRAGTSTPFYTGNNITTNQANYDGNYPYNNNAKGEYRRKTWEVGSGTPNSWGLYDMSGNVREWCWDWYGAYSSGTQTDPAGVAGGSYRVGRGGSWLGSAQGVRSAYRLNYTPSNGYNFLGFRLVRP
jgi:formylglycine-generating enzyme required for sulfatase activity